MALPATSGRLAVAGPATPPQSREAQSPRDLGLSCSGIGRAGPHRRLEGIRSFAVHVPREIRRISVVRPPDTLSDTRAPVGSVPFDVQVCS